MPRDPLQRSDPHEQDAVTLQRAADRERDPRREVDDNEDPHYGPGMGEDEHGDAPGASSSAHVPAVGLDDQRVSEVPETTPRPGESEAEAAARLRRRGGGQRAWGSPEDEPDHDNNEVYVQQDKTHS